jgi:amino acid permease
MGAGCLAMPMLAAGPNFIFSSIAIILIGLFSYLIAKISLEIFLLHKNEANLSTIVKQSFGNWAVVLSGIINGALMYALLAVYMIGGSDLLDKTIFPLFKWNISNQNALILFLLASLPIFLKGSDLVVKSNKVVFTIKLISFIVAVLVGLRFLTPNLGQLVSEEARYLPKGLPIFFAALWFHFMIPVVAKINGYERKRCNLVFLVGILIPIALYILWIAIMLSLIPRDGVGNTFFSLLSHNESVGTMISYATHNNPHLPEIMKIALRTFSNIAMLTSFLTVGLSTYDYIRDAFSLQQGTLGRARNVAFTLLPPTFLALFFPKGFVFVLQQAAILLMLINIITLSCTLREYNSLIVKPSKLLIWLALFGVVALIGLQLLDNFNILPAFGV